MKNLMMAIMVVLASATMSFAQSTNSGQPITVKAKQAAQLAGCLDDYHGPLQYQVNVVASCFAGGFVTEVIIAPKCTGPNCDVVRIAPIAMVTFNCDEEVSNAIVTCL